LALLTCACALPRTAAAQDNSNWHPWATLFDGKTLDGWNKIGDATWALVKDPGGDYVEGSKATGFLVTPKSYGNFTLRVEFWADTPANSGIFIRAQDPKTITADNAYEINIFDTRPDQTYRTGGVVNVAKPRRKVDSGDGQWHTYEVIVDGGGITVKWDGAIISEGFDYKHKAGPIALQYSAGVVRFRKVEIQAR
jgi:hypothetical protein